MDIVHLPREFVVTATFFLSLLELMLFTVSVPTEMQDFFYEKIAIFYEGIQHEYSYKAIVPNSITTARQLTLKSKIKSKSMANNRQ